MFLWLPHKNVWSKVLAIKSQLSNIYDQIKLFRNAFFFLRGISIQFTANELRPGQVNCLTSEIFENHMQVGDHFSIS